MENPYASPAEPLANGNSNVGVKKQYNFRWTLILLSLLFTTVASLAVSSDLATIYEAGSISAEPVLKLVCAILFFVSFVLAVANQPKFGWAAFTLSILSMVLFEV